MVLYLASVACAAICSYGHACIQPYIKTVELTSLAWWPVNIHDGIIRVPPNSAKIIPTSNRLIYMYILLNAIQTHINQFSDNRRQFLERFQPFLYIAGSISFQQKIFATGI